MSLKKIKHLLSETHELNAQEGIQKFTDHLMIALTEAKKSSFLSNSENLKAIILSLADEHNNDHEVEINRWTNAQDKESLSDIEKLRRALKPKHKKAILVRDAYRCVNCNSHEHLCVDHKTPLCRGGDNHESNLQTLCRSCNRSKGSKTMQEWGVSNEL